MTSKYMDDILNPEIPTEERMDLLDSFTYGKIAYIREQDCGREKET